MNKIVIVKRSDNLHPKEAELFTQNSKLWGASNYCIHFGNKNTKIQLTLRSHQDKEDQLVLSTKLYNLLNLPIENSKIQIHLNKDKKILILGPLIGIFIRRRRKSKKLTSLQRKVLEHYLNQARSLHYYAYAFSAEDIDWDQKVIQGYVINENNVLSKKLLPFPDVMYDQNCSRTYEKLPYVIKSLKKLHNSIPQYFNPGYLDKWEIFNYMSTHKIAQKYHPPTQLLEDVKQVATEVNKYGTVYIKPINGTQGRGIITVVKKNNFYEYRYQGKTLIEGKCRSKKKLEEFISNSIKKETYIIQKGLPLVKINGSPMDIRVLMQKNDKGKWIRTKMFARISKPGTIISNLSLGGEAKSIDEALSGNISKSLMDTIKKKLIQASRIIPKALEEQSEKHFGELGLDLGITENGELWLIEINSKPWKAIETTVGNEELVEKSFRRPIEYAGYIANYGNKKEV